MNAIMSHNKLNIINPNMINIENGIPIIFQIKIDENDKDIYIIDSICPRAALEVYCVVNSRNTQFKNFITYLNTSPDLSVANCDNNMKSLNEKFYEFRLKYSTLALTSLLNDTFSSKQIDISNKNIENNLKQLACSVDFGCFCSSFDVIDYFSKLADIKTLMELANTFDNLNDLVIELTNKVLSLNNPDIIMRDFRNINIRERIHRILDKIARYNMHCSNYLSMFTACETLYKYICYHSNKHMIEYLQAFFNYLNPNYLSYVPKSEKYINVSICSKLEEKAKRVIDIIKNNVKDEIDIDFSSIYNIHTFTNNFTNNFTNRLDLSNKENHLNNGVPRYIKEENNNFSKMFKNCGCNAKQNCNTCYVQDSSSSCNSYIKNCGCTNNRWCNDCNRFSYSELKNSDNLNFLDRDMKNNYTANSLLKNCGCNTKQNCNTCFEQNQENHFGHRDNNHNSNYANNRPILLCSCNQEQWCNTCESKKKRTNKNNLNSEAYRYKCKCINDQRCMICDNTIDLKQLNMSSKISRCDGRDFKGIQCNKNIIIDVNTPSAIYKGSKVKFCSSACMTRTKGLEEDDDDENEDIDEDLTSS